MVGKNTITKDGKRSLLPNPKFKLYESELNKVQGTGVQAIPCRAYCTHERFSILENLTTSSSNSIDGRSFSSLEDSFTDMQDLVT